MGTLDYIAPEQAMDSHRVDIRADLYSLGCTFYYLLTGHVPFPGGEALAKLLKHRTEEPRPLEQLRPDVPGPVAALVRKLMAKSPQDRFQTPAELAVALEQVMRTGTSTASSPSASRVSSIKATGPALHRQEASEADQRWAEVVRSGDTMPLAEPARTPYRAEASRARRRRLVYLLGGVPLGLGLLVILWRPWESRSVVPERVPLGSPRPRERVSPVPPDPVSVNAPKQSAFDALERANIPAHELAAAGAGAPNRASRELVAVFGDSRLMHWDQCNSVAFRPDGKHLASSDRDGAIRIWDTHTGQEVLSFRHDRYASVRTVAYSPDGKLLVTASSDQTVRIWDAANGEAKFVLREHQAPVNAAAFSPDGKRLASVSDDKTAIIWNANAGQRLHVLKGHAAAVLWVAFHQDGKRLATASADQTVRIWDSESGQEIVVYRDHDKAVTCVAFSPDSKHMACLTDDGTVKFWNLDSAKCTAFAKNPIFAYREPGEPKEGLSFSPDGTLLAVGSLLLDTTTANVLRTLETTSPTRGVAFSADGQRLATAGGYAACVRLWDTATWQQVFPHAGHQGPVHRLTLSPDSRHLASASGDQTARLWDTSTGRHTIIRTATIGGLSFSPDSRTLALADGEGSLTRWDVRAGRELPAPEVERGCYDVCYHPSGRFLAVGGDKRTVQIFDVTTGKALNVLRDHEGPINRVLYSSDGRRLASAGYTEEPIRLWEATTGQLLLTLPGMKQRTDSMAFSPDGRFLVPTSHYYGPLRAWDVNTGKGDRQFDPGPWGCAAFSPDGGTVASGNRTGQMVLWEFATGEKRQEWQLPGWIYSVAFAADGRHLVTGNGNGTIYVFRVPAPQSAPATVPK